MRKKTGMREFHVGILIFTVNARTLASHWTSHRTGRTHAPYPSQIAPRPTPRASRHARGFIANIGMITIVGELVTSWRAGAVAQTIMVTVLVRTWAQTKGVIVLGLANHLDNVTPVIKMVRALMMGLLIVANIPINTLLIKINVKELMTIILLMKQEFGTKVGYILVLAAMGQPDLRRGPTIV